MGYCIFPDTNRQKWFYDQIEGLITKKGHETFKIRNHLGLNKINNKLSNSFYAHCVDSWVLANSITGGHIKPDNTMVLCIRPLKFHRRQLHVFVPNEGGIRKRYGGTRSLGIKRGSLVRHKQLGVVYVSGHSNNMLSLYSLQGKRLGQKFIYADCKFLCYNSWVEWRGE